jgi:hypothetical protein
MDGSQVKGSRRDGLAGRFHRFGAKHWSCLALLGLLALPSVASADERLLLRSKVNGRETGLYEKVVVTGARAAISKTPAAQGQPIEPFAIFFKLRTDSGGTEENGFVRIGTSEGNHLGWINRSDVSEWNTRFVLEPLQATPDRAFRVDTEGGGAAVLQDAPPEGKRRFALITRQPQADQGDDTPYPVVVYAGNVQSQGMGGALARERNQLEDLKLEIVFVVESTDFMMIDFGGVRLMDSVKQLIRDSMALIRQNKELEGAVRFGLVEYQDKTENAKFTSRLTCGLTDKSDKTLSSLDTIDPTKLKDDWPDDVISGLATAVNEAGWSENSSKHIILIGMASCQLYAKGQAPNEYGFDANMVTGRYRKLNDSLKGYNTTGLSLPQLIARANPEGGTSADKARKAITFHSVLAGKELRKLDPELIKSIDKIVHFDDEQLSKLIDRLKEGGKDSDPVEIILDIFGYYLVNHQRELARSQYRELSQNNGIDGLFLTVEPNAESIRQVTRTISSTLSAAFTTLAGVRSGRVGTEQLGRESNQITGRFYALVGAATAKFKDEATIPGTARVRDDRGHEVAQRKVLVARNELQRLQSTLDAIHQKFQARVAKVDRQDVSKILDELKEITVATTTGQPLAPGVKLRDVISDLPLRTTALDITAADIAVMPSDAFTQWLNKLETARFRTRDLLDGKADWLELSPLAANDKFTFLRLNELP